MNDVANRTADPVTRSLEIAAANAGDITEDVYRRYFAACPGSEALMSHIDHLVRGKMLEEVFRLIMLDDYAGEQQYLDFEVANHKHAYSVEPHMYGNLLQALQDAVRDAVGEDWTRGYEAAWNARRERLLAEIRVRHE